MRRIMKIWPLTLLMILVSASGQARELSFNAYMQMVVDHHPVLRQADLMVEKGEAEVLTAKGNADPVLTGDLRRKEYQGRQYYRLLNGGLKIPTWYAVSVKAGYENFDGLYLNPENNVPQAGLWNAGISVPLGQGLFIDKRRAQLRKAKIYREMSFAQRDLLVNEILYKAGSAYWDWFMAHNILDVYEEAVSAAQLRLNAVKRGVSVGDKAAIDTVEANIQLMTRQLGAQQARLDLNKARMELSNHLWLEGYIPIELDSIVVPSSLDTIPLVMPSDSLRASVTSLIEDHPVLNAGQNKIDMLEVERRYRAELLKPKLDVEYTPLSTSTGSFVPSADMDGYKLGVSFNMPILLRTERGMLNKAKIDLEYAELELSKNQTDINVSVRQSFYDWENSIDQVELYARTVDAYSQLLDAERRLFTGGESSLFMVNAREILYIQTQVKWAQLVTKSQRSALRTKYVLGMLKVEMFE